MNSTVEYRQPVIDAIYAECFTDDEPGGGSCSVETDISEWTQVDKDLCSKIAVSKQGEKFRKLFAGAINDYPSHSEADMGLSSILAFWTQKDSKAMDRIFRQSGLYRSKWDDKHGKETYGAMTIGKAIAGTTEIYQPPGSTPADDFSGVNKVKTIKQFELVHVGDLLRNIKPTDWLIKGFLEDEALAVMFGEPGSYKSFMALSWALSIATGTAWFGHEVKQGPVFIFIGEGHRGYGKRIAAWVIGARSAAENAPVYISTAPAQMLDVQSAQQVGDAINCLRKKHGTPALVLFDTLARNFGPGDENSTADMTRFISHLDSYVGNDFTRLLIHHTGHGDKTRGRGSSVLKGAADAEYRVAKQDNSVALSSEKMKDAETFKPMSFKPEVITVGGSFEEPITSVYLTKTEAAIQPAPKLSPQMRQTLSLLDLMNRKSGISCLSDWMNICRDEEVYTKAGFYNATNTMEDKRIIKISNGCVNRS